MILKKFAKLIALILALVLVLSLAACKKSGDAETQASAPAADEGKQSTDANVETDANAETDAPATDAPATEAPAAEGDIVGKWSCELSIEALMQANAGNTDEQSMGMVKTLFGDGSIIVNLEFNADGTTVFSMDQESIKALMNNMINNIDAIIPQIVEAQGMTQEDFAAALEQQGMTMDQFKEQLAEQFKDEDLLGDLDNTSATGTYKLEGDKLFITAEGKEINDSQYLVIDLTANTLVIKEVVGIEDLGNDMDLEGMEKMLPWTFNRVG